MGSGLYDELVSEGLLIEHEEVATSLAATSGAYKVLAPRAIPFWSYPYEWCFSQLRDAAAVTLRIQRTALERGLTLKDASAYNIQFSGGRAVLVDTLSFEKREAGKPWIAYRQFCEHFLAPLRLMTSVDVRMGQLHATNIDGIPLDLASRLLPRRSWLRLSVLLHVHLHARSIARYAGTRPEDHSMYRKMSDTSMVGLIDGLQSTIDRMRPPSLDSQWSDYDEEHSYDPNELARKEEFVLGVADQLGPKLVWDLGANTGHFSRLIAEAGSGVVAIDADYGAVERHYAALRGSRLTRVLPLRIDLANPSPDLGWAGSERASLSARGPVDLVLALALVHHLALTHGVPLDRIASWLHGVATNLIVEFVPKSDPQTQRLLLSRSDIFANYTEPGFREAFAPWFMVRRMDEISSTGRKLFWMERATL